MAGIEARLRDLGLELPAPIRLPPEVVVRFPWVNVRGDRAFVSGHVPLAVDGSLARPLGRVGDQATPEEAHGAARLAGFAILASLKTELGDLDRVVAWLRVFGMVNTAPAFNSYPMVINGFTDLILDLYGPHRGRHARSAVGMAGLPLGGPLEIEAEVLIRP
jgi:enamine deaminase RidA (YjgF/YER057c/UK114 family)